ncbi:MAG: SAM-dependent methyltransferase [Ferruginibacter sp.]
MGASAYAGIPLTARGYSASVRFLTYHNADVITDAQWKEIAATDDTLVFYMTGEKLDIVADHLIKNDIAADKLLAVIEQSTTPMQQVHITNFYDYHQTLKGKTFASPSLVIIGRVVALHEQFAWIKSSDTEQDYFKPLGKIPNL